jgi:hypothetical protein
MFGFSDAQQALALHPKGIAREIPGSAWFFTTHGIGVDIGRSDGSGGIDFDFDKPDPDAWRLLRFAEKQLHAGNLPDRGYAELVCDQERFVAAGARNLESTA